MAKNKFLFKIYKRNGEIDNMNSGFVDVSFLIQQKLDNCYCHPTFDFENDSPNHKSHPVNRKTTINDTLLTEAFLDELIGTDANIKILEESDWIVAKIQEASILGEDTQPLLDKYSGELQARKTARAALDAIPNYSEDDEVVYNGKGIRTA